VAGYDCHLPIRIDTAIDGRTLRWTLTEADRGNCPDLPHEAGMLPPDDAAGRGAGHVSFTVEAEEDTDEEETIDNYATIKFDSGSLVTTEQPASHRFSRFLTPAAPRNPSPADGLDPPVAVDTPLCWGRSEGAYCYDVLLWKDGAEPLAPTAPCVRNVCFAPPGGLDPATVYRWQVVARNVNNQPAHGPVWSFETRPACPPPPRNFSVEDASCWSPYPSFRWDPSEGAAGYAVLLRRSGQTMPRVLAEGLAATTFRQDEALPAGTYFCQVAATNAGCPGLETGARSAPLLLTVRERGDANGDGRVDLSDAVLILFSLFGGSGPLPCERIADSNGNGDVDLSDAVFLLGYLFAGGEAPQAARSGR
jgi:hypothetical protein